jgi:hypothetical protein
LSGKLFASAGWTELDERVLPLRWHGTTDGGVNASAGLGLGLFWDVIQMDIARGLTGGSWGLSISAARRFRGWL